MPLPYQAKVKTMTVYLILTVTRKREIVQTDRIEVWQNFNEACERKKFLSTIDGTDFKRIIRAKQIDSLETVQNSAFGDILLAAKQNENTNF